jgi:hypothetical protein
VGDSYFTYHTKWRDTVLWKEVSKNFSSTFKLEAKISLAEMAFLLKHIISGNFKVATGKFDKSNGRRNTTDLRTMGKNGH